VPDAIVIIMARRDRWTVKLTCDGCSQIGEARMSDADQHSFIAGNRDARVDDVSAGFRQAPSGGHHADARFVCVVCGKRAKER
jgi:DNA-directed RNA polymerase subunit M/transcription elongation factor TFIIS